VGSDLGQLPTGEVGPALLRALLPVLASLQHDLARANEALIKTAAALNSITVPIGLAFAAMAVPATSLILGPSWAEAVQFVVVFALVSTVQLMSNPLNTLLIMRGHTKLQSHLVWLEFAAFLCLTALLVTASGLGLGLYGLALARLGASLLNLMSTAAVARAHCHLSLRRLAFAIGRPTIGAVLMYGLISMVLPLPDTPLGQIGVGVLVGGCFMLLWSFVTWRLAGTPEGFESTLVDGVQRWRKERVLRSSVS
jgi:O-antigen/teichoic acid export membrane protein